LQEVGKPGRVAGNEHATRLNHWRLGRHAHRFVALGLDGHDTREAFALKFLDKLHARRSVFDQDDPGTKLLGHFTDLSFQFGIFKPGTKDVEKEYLLLEGLAPGRADAMVGELARL